LPLSAATLIAGATTLVAAAFAVAAFTGGGDQALLFSGVQKPFANGFSTEAMLMSQVIGFSTVLLSYQASPLVAGIRVGGVRGADIACCALRWYFTPLPSCCGLPTFDGKLSD
jgi:hypothetical protein|tara:strand:+ start:697 stop:1035 length:339 start_codon:yes stop_codon:yes gene_type:complete